LSSYWQAITLKRLARRRALTVTGSAAVGAAFLVACGGGGGGKAGEQEGLLSKAVETTDQAKRGGTLKDHATTDTPTFDFSTPISAGGGSTSCYACFVRAKPGYLEPTKSELEPDMAESWEVSPDGLTVTLKIRQGVKFHNKPPVNGRTMDIDDVLFSWKRFVDKASNGVNVANSRNPGAPVLSLTASDSRTVVLKLKEPVTYVLELFAPYTGGGNMAMLPKETDSTFDIRTDVIGTHAFMMYDYKPSVGFYFRRHPDYYDKDYALVETREVPILTEEAQRIAQLKAGNLHYYTNIKSEDVLPVKREEPRLQIFPTDVDFPSGTTASMSFGWLPEGKSPFLDERMRQAWSMSLDRDLWLDTFFNVSNFAAEGLPVATRWNSHVNANWDGWWLDPKSKDFGPNAKYFQHDLAEAKKLMAAAGYPNGLDLVSHLDGPSGPQGATTKFALVAENMASEAGFRVKVDYVDYNSQYIPLYRDGQGQYEGISWHSTSGASALTLTPIRALAAEFWPQGGVAYHGFSTSGKNDKSGDPQLNALIEKARLEQDRAKAIGIVHDIQRYLAKANWGMRQAGGAARFTVAWPALGNYQVWRGGHWPYYRYWLDDTKPPFKSA
jgi:ABC-type transport system substrate-binding protein